MYVRIHTYILLRYLLEKNELDKILCLWDV
jgi:hypothetical protein